MCPYLVIQPAAWSPQWGQVMGMNIDYTHWVYPRDYKKRRQHNMKLQLIDPDIPSSTGGLMVSPRGKTAWIIGEAKVN